VIDAGRGDQASTLAHPLDKFMAAANPNVVFSHPVEKGGYTVITASEITAGGGFGYGSGSSRQAGQSDEIEGAGGQGGGGGGGSSGRPVAVISIGPDGVKVQPIVDVTKLALAAVTAWGAMALFLGRMARRS